MNKDLTKLLSQSTVIIIVLSLIKNTIYYYNFNLPIKYFVGLSELGLLIGDDLIICILLVIFSYLIVKDEPKGEFFNFFDSAKTHIKENNKFFGCGVVIIFSLFNIGVMVILPIYILVNDFPFHFKILASFAIFLFIFFLFIWAKNQKVLAIITNERRGLLGYIIVFLLYFLILLTNDISSAENGKYTGTTISTKDSVYTSTDSTFYIGQTANYIFIYHKLNKHNTIIPLSEVIKFELFIKEEK